MDWNVISAIAGVCGTVLTFVSILVAIGLERQKNMSKQNKSAKPVNERPRTNSQLPKELVERQRRIFRPSEPFYDDSLESNGNNDDDVPHDPYAPYLYISVGLIGACGGVASILVPWLLLISSPQWQCLLYPLLIAGLIGGVAFALVMDLYFGMDKTTPYLRFPLSAISGVLGGWIGLLLIFIWLAYQMATAEPTSFQNRQDGQKP
jgi:hypothetical protein